MTFTQYAWLAGHNAALASLSNVENELRPHNYRTLGGAKYPVGIRSQPVNAFPVRRVTLSGKERGGGTINHVWELLITTYAADFILDTYLAGGTAVSAPMTIYTRRHEMNNYARYNAYLVLPAPGEDIVYERQHVVRVRLRFRDLVAL